MLDPRQRDSTPPDFLAAPIIRRPAATGPSDNATMSETRDVPVRSDLTPV
jgi:hypothetical protein